MPKGPESETAMDGEEAGEGTEGDLYGNRRAGVPGLLKEGSPMIAWVLVFFIVAIVAGVLGFTGIAGAAAEIAKIIFVIFLVLLAVSLVASALRGRPPL